MPGDALRENACLKCFPKSGSHYSTAVSGGRCHVLCEYPQFACKEPDLPGGWNAPRQHKLLDSGAYPTGLRSSRRQPVHDDATLQYCGLVTARRDVFVPAERVCEQLRPWPERRMQ